MRRGEDDVGIGQGVRTYVYRIWLAKESRKYWGRVTQRALHTHRRAGAGGACAWADCHRTRPTRNEGAHRVSHATTHQTTGQSQTAPPPHSAGAPRTRPSPSTTGC